MIDKKNSTLNKILEYPLKNKLTTSITFIVYLLIYKVIDMNTIQWFGDEIFIDPNKGSIIEFIVCSILFGSAIIFVYSIIADALKGKLF